MRLRSPFSFLAVASLAVVAHAQKAPTAYAITQSASMGGPEVTSTTYRNGSKAMVEISHPAQGAIPAGSSRTVYDIAAGKSWSWDPTQPANCSVGTFSGDWGDPFLSTSELTDGIDKGELKPAGAETIHGFATKVYTGQTQGMTIKIWLDSDINLVLKAQMGQSPTAMTTMVNITKLSLVAPADAVFEVPPACAALKPAPTQAETFAAETGDDAANYVNANYGPGSANACTIVLSVVDSKTMTPTKRRWQVALDTTYDQNSPTAPHYEFGVGTDGTSTFAGGGLHEISSQIHNGMLRIENPPAYFNLALNVVTPGHGAGTGLVYRQCFAPVTMLYYVLKDPNGADGGYLYAKAGKYATPPAK